MKTKIAQLTLVRMIVSALTCAVVVACVSFLDGFAEQFSWEAEAGVGRWTRSGPRDPRDNSRFVLINDKAMVAGAGISSTIGDLNAIYAGSNGQGVFKSVDNGANWFSASRGLPTDAQGRPDFDPNFIAICYRDSSKLYVASIVGEIYRSIDSGGSWRSVYRSGIPGTSRNPNTFAVDAYNPNIVFMGVSGQSSASGVYKSVNGGQDWTPMGEGLPSQTVYVLAVDPTGSNTIYAAVRKNSDLRGLGLYRRRNAALTWESANIGLPTNAEISSIAISPSHPNVVYVGLTATAANGTHRVYRSDNGGDSWGIMSLTLQRLSPLLVFDDALAARDGRRSLDEKFLMPVSKHVR